MIIVRVCGGLGNQMQQYALYQKLLSLGKEAKLDVSWFADKKAQASVLAPRELELTRFGNLPMEIAAEEEIRKLRGGNGLSGKLAKKLHLTRVFEESRMYHPEIFSMEDAYLEGYFACNKYYADILPKLRGLFRFPQIEDPSTREANDELLKKMQSKGEIPVAVHIRRGDYLDAGNAKILTGICTEDYYRSACALAEEHFAKEGLPIHFYVFSDDPAFAESCRFGTRGEENTVVNVNHGQDAMQDIRLMAACRGIITANSTFSFWGARLNPDPAALKIRPFRHRNNQIPDPEAMHDYWAGYALIDRDGKLR